MAFRGAKAALLRGSRLVVLRRDDVATIPYPGMIDLPGGGREGEESPETCAAREILEKTGLRIDPVRFRWVRAYHGPRGCAWFFAARITGGEARGLRLGAEGQAIWLMEAFAFLSAPDAVPHLRDRLRHALAGGASGRGRMQGDSRF